MTGRRFVALNVIPFDWISAVAVIRAFWYQSKLTMSQLGSAFHSVTLLKRVSDILRSTLTISHMW